MGCPLKVKKKKKEKDTVESGNEEKNETGERYTLFFLSTCFDMPLPTLIMH